MLRPADFILLIASAVLLFLSTWIVVPAPHSALYPIAVGSPEVSPALLAGSVILLIISARRIRRDRTARLTLAFAAIASVLALVPVVQLPIALARFDRAMAATTANAPEMLSGEIRVTRNVQFSKADGVPLSLDVYQPAAQGPVPVIMQIYGGSWQSGTPRSQEWFSRYFAERGYLVVAIDYRHAPEWIWPEQIVDVRTALYWLSQEAAKFGGDPSRIVLVGRSAGAQLAMRLAYQEGPSSIRAVVNYYGPVDLAAGWRQPPRPDPANVRAIRRGVYRRHAESEAGALPARVANHLGIKGGRADLEHLWLAGPHRRSALRTDAAFSADERRDDVSAARAAMVRAFL